MITVAGARVTKEARAAGRNAKKAIFKNFVTSTDCIRKINNTQVDNAKDSDVVMSMYNLIKYSVNYSKTWEVLNSFEEMIQKILQQTLNHLNINQGSSMSERNFSRCSLPQNALIVFVAGQEDFENEDDLTSFGTSSEF